MAVVCGMRDKNFGFLYFDAHDDLDSPDNNENGYFDAMGLSMLRGESWKHLAPTVPGFKPLTYGRFLYIGLRDQSEFQRQNVINSGMDVIWGKKNRNFHEELVKRISLKDYTPAIVHLDLDCSDESYGRVNVYPSPNGFFEDDLYECMATVGEKGKPIYLIVVSFDLDAGDGDRIAKISIKALTAFFNAWIAQ
jgi:arginase